MSRFPSRVAALAYGPPDEPAGPGRARGHHTAACELHRAGTIPPGARASIVRLSESMELTLRERNALLLAAGFAPAFPESPLDDDALRPVRDALDTILDGHLPYPAMVVRPHGILVVANRAFDLFHEGVDPGAADAAGQRLPPRSPPRRHRPPGAQPAGVGPTHHREPAGTARAKPGPVVGRVARRARGLPAAAPAADRRARLRRSRWNWAPPTATSASSPHSRRSRPPPTSRSPSCTSRRSCLPTNAPPRSCAADGGDHRRCPGDRRPAPSFLRGARARPREVPCRQHGVRRVLRDETIMGFAFPREEREALVASEPTSSSCPIPQTCGTGGSASVSTRSTSTSCGSSSSTHGAWLSPRRWPPPTKVDGCVGALSRAASGARRSSALRGPVRST